MVGATVCNDNVWNNGEKKKIKKKKKRKEENGWKNCNGFQIMGSKINRRVHNVLIERGIFEKKKKKV